MSRGRDTADRILARIMTVLAAALALAVTVVLPAAYYLSAYATSHTAITAEAKLAASSITQLASSNPGFWVYENARMRGLMAFLGTPSEPERRLVRAVGGEVIAEQDVGDPQRPLMTARYPVYDSGAVVGSVEIERSQRRMLWITAGVAVLAGLLGAVAFSILRSLPLRLLHRALARSQHLATHDTLTGLPNRALFHDRVEQALAWARRDASMLAVLYLDLDRFKEVNDTLGHAAGDRLLVDVAARLRDCIRETDTLGRLGGDEFAIVQLGVRQFGDTELLAQRLIDSLDRAFDLDGNLMTIGVSIGISLRSSDAMAGVNAGTLLQEADTALYRAKEEGRGTYRFFAAEMNAKLLERRALEADILEALATGQFSLRYQPQYDLARNEIVGAEALLRWHHPVRGVVTPDQFIPLAEETGLIVRIGEWVLDEACRQAVAWPELPRMAVNVSPVQFRRAGFFDQVQRALQQTGLQPGRLEVEITEGVLLHDTDDTLATLGRLRALGVAIAMDDFGTGYSSLGYLQKFRFDKIKIDRSFIGALSSDIHAVEIVRAVLRMSHAMGIRVNAEGIEDEAQALMLRDEGCEEAQGFLFGRALPVREFAALLAVDAAPVSVREREPA